jgi:hypothetical protein
VQVVAEELEKYERIKQLERLGQNVPLLMRISCGTRFTKTLEKQLLDFAHGHKLMTVRTYAPTDEKFRGGGPFYPEISVTKAIAKVRDLLPHYHVLFQEAIDINKTKFVGRTLFDLSGRNSFEVLRGKVRVRDLDHPPHGLRPVIGFFLRPDEIEDPEIRCVTQRISRIPLALGELGPIVVEWNLQNPTDLVGVRKEPFLLWEWRPGA